MWIEELVAALGAEPVQYRKKMQCCGAGGGVRGYDLVHSLDITNEKMINLHEAKVDAVTEVCPFCQLEFDRGQIEIHENSARCGPSSTPLQRTPGPCPGDEPNGPGAGPPCDSRGSVPEEDPVRCNNG